MKISSMVQQKVCNRSLLHLVLITPNVVTLQAELKRLRIV